MIISKHKMGCGGGEKKRSKKTKAGIAPLEVTIILNIEQKMDN